MAKYSCVEKPETVGDGVGLLGKVALCDGGDFR